MQEGVYDEFVRLATERAKQRKVIVMHYKHQSHSVCFSTISIPIFTIILTKVIIANTKITS